MLLCFFLKLFLKGLNTILDLSTLLAVDLVDVGGASVMHTLIKDPCPIEPNHAFLKLLVAQVVLEQHLLDIIFESFHCIILTGNFVLHLVCSFAKALLSHAKIVYDQDKILVDSVKVFLFRSHFVGLLVKFLNLDFLRANVSFQLLDLVIQNEFELFKLLDLLL